MFDDAVITAIKRHAEQEYPLECCGLVIQDNDAKASYLPCLNVAEEPEHNATVDNELLLSYLKEDTLLALVHSHIDDMQRYPSVQDMETQLSLDVPCAIVHVTGGVVDEMFWWGDGAPIPDLLDRCYRWGVTDCLTIIKHYFALHFDITIGDKPRHFRWYRNTESSLLDDYKSRGFVEVEFKNARQHDVLVMQVNAPVPNHLAVIEKPGVMLHHAGHLHSGAYDETAKPMRESIARWQQFVVKVLRHESML